MTPRFPLTFSNAQTQPILGTPMPGTRKSRIVHPVPTPSLILPAGTQGARPGATVRCGARQQFLQWLLLVLPADPPPQTAGGSARRFFRSTSIDDGTVPTFDTAIQPPGAVRLAGWLAGWPGAVSSSLKPAYSSTVQDRAVQDREYAAASIKCFAKSPIVPEPPSITPMRRPPQSTRTTTLSPVSHTTRAQPTRAHSLTYIGDEIANRAQVPP